jgi:DNA sulfur modification protein DndD
MLFKSIKIKNFQQFISKEIQFSINLEKNITLICGANASGKTTIVNAMKRCLFDDEKISNTNLLNRIWYRMFCVKSMLQCVKKRKLSILTV